MITKKIFMIAAERMSQTILRTSGQINFQLLESVTKKVKTIIKMVKIA